MPNGRPKINKIQRQSDRWGGNSNHSLNVYFHYPTDLVRTLNDAVPDKVLQYRADFNNRPSHVITLIPDISRTSGRLPIEFVCLLFLQTHRETDRFLAISRVQITTD